MARSLDCLPCSTPRPPTRWEPAPHAVSPTVPSPQGRGCLSASTPLIPSSHLAPPLASPLKLPAPARAGTFRVPQGTKLPGQEAGGLRDTSRGALPC